MHANISDRSYLKSVQNKKGVDLLGSRGSIFRVYFALLRKSFEETSIWTMKFENDVKK